MCVCPVAGFSFTNERARRQRRTASLCSTGGLLLIAYKTIKLLKARVDLTVEAINVEFAATTSPIKRGSAAEALADRPTSRSLVGTPGGKVASPETPDVSSPERALEDVNRKLEDTELNIEQVFQFWILFGLLQFLASYHVLYSVQLKALLILVTLVPTPAWLDKQELLKIAFKAVAPKFLGVHVPAFIRWAKRKLRTAVGLFLPLIRVATRSTVPSGLLSTAETSGKCNHRGW